MTTRRTPSQKRPLLTVLGVFALLAVACGTNTTAISAERVAEPAVSPLEALSPAEAPAPLVASPSQETTAPAESTSPAGTSHDYGTSIDEWVEDPPESGSGQESASTSDVPTVEWGDLIPAGFSGEEIVARYEDQLDAAEPGSEEANAVLEMMRADYNPEVVNFDLDGQRIRLAGFVAPLTYVDDLVTEFLLVPTFGACIHVPPPPPNQTIMVTLDSSNGLTTDESWGAVWVEGTITVQPAETDLASASYTITNATSGSYNDI